MPRILSIFWLCLLTVAPVASAQDGEALLARLRSRFESVRTFQAQFSQRTLSPIFEDGQDTILGTLYVRGEAYRLESGTRTLVNDGTTLWIYDAAESQVLVSDNVEDEYTFSITGFLYRFDERWTFDSVEKADGAWVLHLSPKNPDDFFRSVAVTMTDSDGTVTRVRVVDANDVTMIFTLDDLVENPPLADTVFRFDAPDGVEVVDLRS
jgi:chaperone LolA